MSRVSSSLDRRILVHLALAADQEEDIEEMEAEVVEDTEVDRPQVLVVDTRVDKVVDLDTVVIRVEATEVTHSVIVVALQGTASHDHLSLEEMHLTMHTLSEVNNLLIQKKNSRNGVLFLLLDHSLCSQYS